MGFPLLSSFTNSYQYQSGGSMLHNMALTSEGRLYTWENGADGRLSHGSELKSGVPSVVESLIGYKVIHIASGFNHSIALVDSKQSYAKNMKAMVNDET